MKDVKRHITVLFQKGNAISLVILLALILLTAAATQATYRYVQQQKLENINSPLSQIEQVIAKELSKYNIFFNGVTGLFQTQDRIDRGEFAQYTLETQQLATIFPEIGAMGFFKLVNRSERARITREENADTTLEEYEYTLPPFNIFPETNSDVSFVTTHLYPLSLYEQFYGYDFSNEPIRSAAINASLQTREFTLTERIELRTGPDGYVGVFPVTKENDVIDGFGFVVFRAPVVLESILGELGDVSGSVRIYDQAYSPSEGILFNNNPDKIDWSDSYQKPIDFFDRTLTIEYYPNPSYLTLLPFVVLLIGLTVSVLLTMWSNRLFTLYKRAQGARGVAEKQLQDSESRFIQAFESSATGTLIVDEMGVIIEANKTILKMTQFQEHKLLGQSIDLLIHQEHKLLGGTLWENLVSGKSSSEQIELMLNTRENIDTWALTSLSTINNTDGSFAYIVAQFTDITKQKNLEHIQQEFVSTASHQLRTPITVLSWELERLAPLLQKHLADQKENTLASMKESVRQMTSLINDLLLISRIDIGSHELKAEKVNLRTMLEKIISAARASFHNEHTVKLSLPKDIDTVMSDPQSLEIIFQNVLSNAVKFSKPEKPIHVTGSKVQDTLVFEIIDSGIGIPDSAKKHIFNRFYRAENSKTLGIQGSGLGLSLAKDHIEKLGGSIDFVSEEGMGTTFYVRIPYIPAS